MEWRSNARGKELTTVASREKRRWDQAAAATDAEGSDPRWPGELRAMAGERGGGRAPLRAAAGRVTRGRALPCSVQLDLDYSLFFLSNRIQS